MVVDKGGIYFDANWFEVQMKYSYSALERPVSCPDPLWEISAAF